MKLLSALTLIRLDKRGVTALEYGLIAAVVAAVMVVGAGAMGANLSSMFTSFAGQV